MTLGPGTTLGPYRIEAAIGAGGMGAVWKARDTRLDRTVAIKTIEGKFTERFEREAKSIASLNHPHICTLHDVGDNYLVMEFIDGQPVKGPLPVAEVVRLGAQIAEAIDAAHRKGITHRDLKPGNVLVTKAGSAKVIDFGLAKGGSPVRGEADLTLTKPLTAEGTILGTVPYMSPEQLQGQEADARSDIFALGCVLYEMLTGKRAFEGKSQVSIMAAILEHEPAPLAAPLVPAWLDRLIRRCLRKNPEDRWQSARDIAIELREPHDAAMATVHRGWLPWAVAGLCAVTAVGAWVAWPGSPKSPRELPTFQIEVFPPEGTTFHELSPGRYAISPDGQTLAVIAQTAQGTSRLYLRSLRDGRYRAMAGTDGATFPFWSPDSRWIGYNANSTLNKIAAVGGAPQPLAEGGVSTSGTWGAGGVIVFGKDGKLWRTPDAAGAAPVLVEEGQSFSPWFLPDGRRFLYSRAASAKGYRTALGSLDSSTSQSVPLIFYDAVYAPVGEREGYLLYTSGGQLFARAFDAGSVSFTGQETPLLDGAPEGPALSASWNGTLAVRRSDGIKRQMKWVDRNGKTLFQLGEPDLISSPALSPDGSRVAYTLAAGVNTDIWVMDGERGVASRLTSGNERERSPVWSPDGREIAYGRNLALARQPWNGSDAAVIAREGCAGPSAWLAKGILCGNVRTFFPLDGAKPVALSHVNARESHGQFSRSGQWLSYTSRETGQEEVYVRSLPQSLGGPANPVKHRVSTAGGSSARWRGDGREIFYLAGDSQLMALPVEPLAGGLRIGVSKPLFRMRSPRTSTSLFPYDAAADGQRFIVLDPLSDASAVPITVIVNWPGLLQARQGGE